jgi:hypothetical protein
MTVAEQFSCKKKKEKKEEASIHYSPMVSCKQLASYVLVTSKSRID